MGAALGAALLGDTTTCALSGADGAIDWWAPGGFGTTPALFRRSDPLGPALRVGPAGPATAGEQSWTRDTAVARTVLSSTSGRVEIVDFMPWLGPGSVPTGRLVRVVTGLAGRVEVAVAVEQAAGPRYSQKHLSVNAFSAGVVVGDMLVRTGFAMDGPSGSVMLEPGERLVVTVDPAGTDIDPISPDQAADLRLRTVSAWRMWSAARYFDGPHADLVGRSLVTMKTLTAAATGAVVDDPLSWRCHLRTVARAVTLAHRLAMEDEAAILSRWLAQVVGDGEPPLAAAHTVLGEAIDEDEHSAATPAVYAGVIDAALPDHPGGEEALASMWSGLARVADHLAEAWDEQRVVAGGVNATLAVWHSLDRMARLAVRRHPLSLDAVGWRLSANEVATWLDEHDDVDDDDTSPELLLATRVGPWRGDERAERAVDQVLDSWSAGEGAAIPADLNLRFAAVTALADLGRWEEAHERMDALVAFADPLGHLPTATDAEFGRPAGERATVASHLGLVEAALALSGGPT